MEGGKERGGERIPLFPSWGKGIFKVVRRENEVEKRKEKRKGEVPSNSSIIGKL